MKTKEDVARLLQDKEFGEPNKLQIVEVHMPKDDAPTPLKLTAEASARNNAKQ